MFNKIELTNLEKCEHCTLTINTGELVYYKGDKKTPGFTGLYFRDDNNFLGLYPTKSGPKIFFESKEYEINSKLNITLFKDEKRRKFCVCDYNIEINYTESPYIDLDNWSEEIDVDLLFMIEQNYKKQEFYDKFTLKM